MTTTPQPMVACRDSVAEGGLSSKRRISPGELLTSSLPRAKNARTRPGQSIGHHVVDPMVTSSTAVRQSLHPRGARDEAPFGEVLSPRHRERLARCAEHAAGPIRPEADRS
jgi:hypothetical protein